MKKFRRVFGIMAGMLFPLCCFAQLTLEDCQKLAAEHYPLIKKYNLIRQTTDYTVRNIQRGYLPRLAVTGQATLQNDVPTLPDVLQQMMTQKGMDVKGLRKDQYHVGLEVNHQLWDGGNIKAQKRLAASQGQVEERQNDVEIYALRSRINELYFGLLWMDEQIRLGENLLNLLTRNRERLTVLEEKGMVMMPDVEAVRAEELKAMQQVRSLQSVQQSLREVLALFIGKEKENLQVLVKPEITEDLQEENQRPELRLFDAQQQQMALRIDRLNRDRYPQISLFANGGYGYPGFDYFENMFHHSWKWTAMAGLRFRWNISSFYTQSNERKRLSLSSRQIENAREVFLFNNRLQATQQRAEWRRYQQMLNEDDEIVRLRQSVRESAETRLQKGVIDVVQLLQELTKENEARIARSGHEIEMLKSLYELKFTLNQ